MNPEQERAAFETWAEQRGMELHKVTPCNGSLPYYADTPGMAAWEAWQARAALQSQDREDAERYRYLTFMLQQAYDGERFERDLMTLYCYISSQYKGDRTVLAEITWRDKSDEPIDLSEAIDRARRIEGNHEIRNR